MRSSAASRARMSIGEALAQLKTEFPDEDIKESKIRFLESEGLVEPERTPSGYRKYSEQDMERLRYILRAQREQYLPLKVIKEHLDAIDRGRDVPSLPRGVGVDLGVTDNSEIRLSRSQLIEAAGIDADLLEQIENHGLVARRPGTTHYDGEALVIARTAGELAAFGIEPRHLRAFKTAADREVGLVEQVVSPIRRSREEGAEGRAAQAINEIAALSVRLHASLVKVGLRSLR